MPAEILGKLDTDSDASMLTSFDDLGPLETAEVNLALSRRTDQIVAEAKASESGYTAGKFIVGLESGKVVAAPYSISLGEKKEE